MRVILSLLMLIGFMMGCQLWSTNSTVPDNLPDLVVIHVQNSLEPSHCLSSYSKQSWKLIVMNIGNSTAQPFVAQVNGETILFEAIDAGEQQMQIVPVKALNSPINVILDPANEIAEQDERNNTAEGYIMTFTPPAPCTVTPPPNS